MFGGGPWRRAVVWVFVLALSGCAHTQSGRAAPTSVLEISCDTPDADVWVDGQYIGQISAVSGQLRLAAGVHRVEVRKPGHFPVQRTVRVEKQAGGAVVVAAELLTDPR
ncbi:PEGA domain-containing protein [Enhygromyxa salina]|uniref:PEGA domain-containing protein n=1 Tax=Enhygromyxa salina TaxID=215803 RepID=UPI0015E6750D|nr:PEGA domain-containing protein [Enhygromyxa salina]